MPPTRCSAIRIAGEQPAPINLGSPASCISLGRRGGIFQFANKDGTAKRSMPVSHAPPNDRWVDGFVADRVSNGFLLVIEMVCIFCN